MVRPAGLGPRRAHAARYSVTFRSSRPPANPSGRPPWASRYASWREIVPSSPGKTWSSIQVWIATPPPAVAQHAERAGLLGVVDQRRGADQPVAAGGGRGARSGCGGCGRRARRSRAGGGRAAPAARRRPRSSPAAGARPTITHRRAPAQPPRAGWPASQAGRGGRGRPSRRRAGPGRARSAAARGRCPRRSRDVGPAAAPARGAASRATTSPASISRRADPPAPAPSVRPAPARRNRSTSPGSGGPSGDAAGGQRACPGGSDSPGGSSHSASPPTASARVSAVGASSPATRMSWSPSTG